jgi:hypothetical protein
MGQGSIRSTVATEEETKAEMEETKAEMEGDKDREIGTTLTIRTVTA